MCKIFIFYRRQNSRPVATLIYEPLAKHSEAKFGTGAVFMDVHGIPLAALTAASNSPHSLPARLLAPCR